MGREKKGTCSMSSTFDLVALREQIYLHMKMAEYPKKSRMEQTPKVPCRVDELADDETVMQTTTTK